MYYSRKKSLEGVSEEITPIWACTQPSCIGWMRDNFAFLAVPVCPQCGSVMMKSERVLYVLENTSPNQSRT